MQLALNGGWHWLVVVHALPTATVVPASGTPASMPKVGRQTPPVQFWPMGQRMHIWPATPQENREALVSHCPLAQQPVGHVTTSHTGVVQLPFWQLWPIGHCAHA